MKFLFALACLLSPAAFAADTTVHIHQGDWEVGASSATGLSQTLSNGSRTYFSLGSDAQYFFADEFSAGLEASISTGGGTSYSAGPLLTKYFAVKDKMAPYVSLSPYSYIRYPWGHYATSRARVGVKFFFNDFVAFGPALQFTHYYAGSYLGSSSNSLSLLGQFSIHF